MEIEGLLARPGLAATDRVLIAAKAAIAPGAWDRLAECVRVARERGEERGRLEEMLLQAVLFFGFPRVVSAFEVAARVWPAEVAPSGGGLPEAEQGAAGQRLFAEIYGEGAGAVEGMLASFHQEFRDFVLTAAYGRVLTRPGLAPRLRELLAVGALAALDQLPQLVAHARGALNFGADTEEVREAVFTGLLDDGATGEIMRRVLRMK